MNPDTIKQYEQLVKDHQCQTQWVQFKKSQADRDKVRAIRDKQKLQSLKHYKTAQETKLAEKKIKLRQTIASVMSCEMKSDATHGTVKKGVGNNEGLRSNEKELTTKQYELSKMSAKNLEDLSHGSDDNILETKKKEYKMKQIDTTKMVERVKMELLKFKEFKGKFNDNYSKCRNTGSQLSIPLIGTFPQNLAAQREKNQTALKALVELNTKYEKLKKC